MSIQLLDTVKKVCVSEWGRSNLFLWSAKGKQKYHEARLKDSNPCPLNLKLGTVNTNHKGIKTYLT